MKFSATIGLLAIASSVVSAAGINQPEANAAGAPALEARGHHYYPGKKHHPKYYKQHGKYYNKHHPKPYKHNNGHPKKHYGKPYHGKPYHGKYPSKYHGGKKNYSPYPYPTFSAKKDPYHHYPTKTYATDYPDPTSDPSTCGDGTWDSYEECEPLHGEYVDPNCDATKCECKYGYKSDGKGGCDPDDSQQPTCNPNGKLDYGEECDPQIGDSGEFCDSTTCKCILGNSPTPDGDCEPLCGNGVIDSKDGEECDPDFKDDRNCSPIDCKCLPNYEPDGNNVCKKKKVETCGNQMLDPNEQCDPTVPGIDDGATCDPDTCTCTLGTPTGFGGCETSACFPNSGPNPCDPDVSRLNCLITCQCAPNYVSNPNGDGTCVEDNSNSCEILRQRGLDTRGICEEQ